MIPAPASARTVFRLRRAISSQFLDGASPVSPVRLAEWNEKVCQCERRVDHLRRDRTECQVTIGGAYQTAARRDFQLSVCGCRMTIWMPAMATSADRTDQRHADLRFSRSTEYRGEVGKHPQKSQAQAAAGRACGMTAASG